MPNIDTERQIPKEMVLARRWLKDVARLENTVSGVCPLCHATMAITEANTLPVYSCLPCRVVMPLPD